MKTKKTTTYNNKDASVFCPTEGGCKSVMFSKHPNLLGRDDYASTKVQNFFEL